MDHLPFLEQKIEGDQLFLAVDADHFEPFEFGELRRDRVAVQAAELEIAVLISHGEELAAERQAQDQEQHFKLALREIVRDEGFEDFIRHEHIPAPREVQFVVHIFRDALPRRFRRSISWNARYTFASERKYSSASSGVIFLPYFSSAYLIMRSLRDSLNDWNAMAAGRDDGKTKTTVQKPPPQIRIYNANKLKSLYHAAIRNMFKKISPVGLPLRVCRPA